MAKDELFEEFARHDPSEQTATFGADSRSCSGPGGWRWRSRCTAMTCELAHDDADARSPTTWRSTASTSCSGSSSAGDYLDPDDPTEHPVDAAVAIEAGGRRWVARRARASRSPSPTGPGDGDVDGVGFAR